MVLEVAAVLVYALVAPLIVTVLAQAAYRRKQAKADAPLISRRVVINLKSGTAVTGVITTHDGGLLTIKGAEVIELERNPVPADGEIIVDRSHVDYIQAL